MSSVQPVTEFDRWIAANPIPENYEYGKGWWDYVEFIQRFAEKFEINDVRVIGRYIIETPPPEESLPMPAVALYGQGALVGLKWDFGKMRMWPLEWTVSVQRRAPYRGPTFGLFDPALDLRADRVDGLTPGWVFGPYQRDTAEFTCELEDEWDVATLLRFVFHEA
jgi:hypothetical protein